MFKLTPKNDRFYEHFDLGTDLMVETADALVRLLDDPGNVREHVKTIERLEHEADLNTHATMELLHRSFITPIDRGDIRRLACAIDDVIDFIDDAALRISLYEVKEILPSAKEMGELLQSACREANKAVDELPNISHRNNILEVCIEIKRLEAEGDRVNHAAHADLFKTGKDPFHVMKWKEILIDLEEALDHCEDLAALLEGIVLENA